MAGARRLGVLLRLLASLLVLGGMADPVFAQTPLACAVVGGTCRPLEEGPASGEVLDNSGSCEFEGGPIKKCYAPAACVDRGGACQPGVSSCSAGATQLGNGQCSSGLCCTVPTTGPTCGELLGHPNGVCSQSSETCQNGYVNRGPTKDPCLSCCELLAGPPPPPPGGGGGQYRVEYLHTDALGSVRMVTDQTGAVVSRQDFYPFGEKIPAGTNGRGLVSVDYSESPNLRQRFTGKERDGESELDYFGARYYSAAQGRFSIPDPLLNSAKPWEPQSWNRYAYVDNNPLRYTDPLGLYKFASSCDEANDSACKADRDRFRAAYDNLKKAAGDLDKGSKERKKLDRVIKRIGEEGTGRTRVAFGDAGGDLGTTLGNKVTINFKGIDTVANGFELNRSEASALDAAVVGHEGGHLGSSIPGLSLITMHTERTALYTESAVNQGLKNTDRVFALWNNSWFQVDKTRQELNRDTAVQQELSRQRAAPKKGQAQQ